MTDVDLYVRGIRTALAAWEVYAGGSQGAGVVRFERGSAAVFPHGPERQVYNNAIPARDLAADGRAAAVAAIEATYAAPGVDHYAVWVHESDRALRAHLERRGYGIAETTRAMGIELNDIRISPPTIELGASDLDLHRRILGLPPRLGLQRRAERRDGAEQRRCLVAHLVDERRGDAVSDHPLARQSPSHQPFRPSRLVTYCNCPSSWDASRGSSPGHDQVEVRVESS